MGLLNNYPCILFLPHIVVFIKNKGKLKEPGLYFISLLLIVILIKFYVESMSNLINIIDYIKRRC